MGHGRMQRGCRVTPNVQEGNKGWYIRCVRVCQIEHAHVRVERGRVEGRGVPIRARDCILTKVSSVWEIRNCKELVFELFKLSIAVGSLLF